MSSSRYSIGFLFRCFLLPSYLLLFYVFLRFKPPNAVIRGNTTAAPFSFTAYIPLSSHSLRSLNVLLEPFTSTPSPYLMSLVFLCPEALVPQFRFHLSRVIKQEAQYHPDTSLNMSLIPVSSPYILHDEIFALASEASTEWVLILDENGINDISEPTLQTLRDGAFFDSTLPGSYSLVSPPLPNATNSRTSSLYWQDPLSLKSPLLVPTSSLKSFFPPRDTIFFLFPSVKLIQVASKMICNLLSQHYALRIFLYSRHHILSAASLKDSEISLTNCTRRLTVHQTIPKTQEQNGGLLAPLSWLLQPTFRPKVLFSVQEDKSLFEGLFSACKPTNTNISRIYIPSTQYAYTDWIGSLSIPELQSTCFYSRTPPLSADDLTFMTDWNTPQITFSIITHNRPHSFNRLLQSLSSSLYFGDDTDPNLLHVAINIDSSADPETKRLAQSFSWLHGSHVQISQRIVHGGLLPAIVESWYPHGNDSYGLLLEDDVELSPLFYAWVKMTILKYRYGTIPNVSQNLFGISLYQQKNLELPLKGRRPFNARVLFSSYPETNIPSNTPYLSSIPCSWGAIYFPEHWREFHDYLSNRLASIDANHDDNDHNDEEPVVPDVRSSRWSHSWKKFFIELVYLRGYVMLYPNYVDFTSFSTNHLEAGSHVRGKISLEKRGLFVLPLVQLSSASSDDETVPTGLLDLPMERLPDFEDLPVLNLTGSLTTLDSLIQIGQERAKYFNAL